MKQFRTPWLSRIARGMLAALLATGCIDATTVYRVPPAAAGGDDGGDDGSSSGAAQDGGDDGAGGGGEGSADSPGD